MDNQLIDYAPSKSASRPKREERGVALFFAIFALMLLSAIAAALILSSSTDTAINGNYRSEEVAYYGAKSGIEEVRDRMMASNPNAIPAASLPKQATDPQLYVLNEGNQPGTAQPWNFMIGTKSNPYADDELCHDGYSYPGLVSVSPDQRCTTLPSATYYNTISDTTTSSTYTPWSGTAAALPYKWVRLGLKLDGSEQKYSTDATTLPASTTLGNLVCWDGHNERVLPSAVAQVVTSCNTAFVTAGVPTPATPVYLVTALGSSSSGARKVLQAEIALTPTTPFPYGLFATSSNCPALSFSGSNAQTDSYTTAGGGTYATTQTAWGGDVGSNGGVSVQQGTVGGIVGVVTGACGGSPFSIGGGSDLGPNCSPASASCVSCPGPTGPLCLKDTGTYLPAPYTFPTPPAPTTPNTTYNPPGCSKGSGLCMVPGTYGNISLSGNATASALTLAPGVYNVNSLIMGGNASITVVPPGAVTFNVGGYGQTEVLKIDGNGITDDTIPNDFTINYAGTGNIDIKGNGSTTAILDAPNATMAQSGNGKWFGSILASTMTIGGNAFFHFDRNAALSPNNNGYYTMVSYREVSY